MERLNVGTLQLCSGGILQGEFLVCVPGSAEFGLSENNNKKAKQISSVSNLPLLLAQAGGSWSLLALLVSQGTEQNKDTQSWSLLSEKETVLLFKQNWTFFIPCRALLISLGTSSCVLLKNFPEMRGSKQCQAQIPKKCSAWCSGRQVPFRTVTRKVRGSVWISGFLSLPEIFC